MTKARIVKRSIRAVAVVALVVPLLAGFATPAAAQGASIVFGVYFCPAGSTVTTVIDGEPTQEGPFIADSFDSVNEAVVTVPDGVPGNILVATCAGLGTVATAISGVPPGTFCPNPDNSNIANYVPPPGQLCMKVFSVAGAGAGDRVGGELSTLLADGAGNRFGDFFEAQRVGVGFAQPQPAAKSVSLNPASSATVARLLVAALALGGMSAFTLRRRKFGVGT